MLSDDRDTEIKQFNKEIRILKKKLERSEADRVRLEETNRNKESVLKRIISELEEYQGILEKKSFDLERAFNELTLMQDKLVEVETMAALGGLVAGVAHEINTPVGTSITLASTLMDETQGLLLAIASGQLRRSHLADYLETAQDSTQLILSNLTRAGELVQSFKQVAVDQSSLEKRLFNVKQYLEEVIVSLSPQFKQTLHRITVDGDRDLEVQSYPGALAQVVTNLVTNSLIHAYLPHERGHLKFDVLRRNDQAIVRYCDDGGGMPKEVLSKVFEPFFTTAREKGGTGLGLYIAYNLVTQKLQGKINVQSEVGKGSQFTIYLPFSVGS
ncbi:HAMP domain-containing sensor histidine kinase [Tumidithrix elongata RA019]|uniref:histidine kinase n=1 Tax=Tumidithrix elongata BACA0141 TaxID=2716417 RepID=A0AAW9Q911_9CYAN|nr:HAMP domain-containing sensor histidine kinase [Tumidithrix elongata RA019]